MSGCATTKDRRQLNSAPSVTEPDVAWSPISFTSTDRLLFVVVPLPSWPDAFKPQHRTVPAPLRQALAEDQRIVAEAQHVFDMFRGRGHFFVSVGPEGRMSQMWAASRARVSRCVCPVPRDCRRPLRVLPHMWFTSSGNR